MWSAIAIVYFACTCLGFLFALIGAVFGELGGHFHIGATHDIGHSVSSAHGFDSATNEQEFIGGGDQMPGASIFNTITVATFVGFFGISGLVAVWGLHMGPFTSIAFAGPVSLAIAAAEFYLYVKLIVHAQSSSEARMADIVGCDATVISTIPANKLGQISYTIHGSRFTAPAAAEDSVEIARGTVVRIIKLKGAVMLVRVV